MLHIVILALTKPSTSSHNCWLGTRNAIIDLSKVLINVLLIASCSRELVGLGAGLHWQMWPWVPVCSCSGWRMARQIQITATLRTCVWCQKEAAETIGPATRSLSCFPFWTTVSPSVKETTAWNREAYERKYSKTLSTVSGPQSTPTHVNCFYHYLSRPDAWHAIPGEKFHSGLAIHLVWGVCVEAVGGLFSRGWALSWHSAL